MIHEHVISDLCYKSVQYVPCVDVRAVGFLALRVLDWGECDAEKQMARYC